MKIAVYNQKGEKQKDINMPKCFDVKNSPLCLTQYINYLRAAKRFPIANSKDRSEVSGGGRKPYKQKGTGNARAGSNRSPLWVGGGVTFGPSNSQNFHIRINGKQRKLVILSMIGQAVALKKLSVIDSLSFETPKTKIAKELLERIKTEGKICVVASKDDKNSISSFRNLVGIWAMNPVKLDALNLISADNIIMSKSALVEIEKIYSPDDNYHINKVVSGSRSKHRDKVE